MCLPVSHVAGLSFRFCELRELKTGFEKSRHVGVERPMPVQNPYSLPLQFKREFVEVTVDRKVQALSFLVLPILALRRQT